MSDNVKRDAHLQGRLNMVTHDEVKSYLERAIASFAGDPADTAYQRGYEAALRDVHEDLFMTTEERKAARANRRDRQVKRIPRHDGSAASGGRT